MEEQNNQQNQNNPFQIEKPNNNIINDNNEEILNLKKEIIFLKNEQKKNNEITNFFKNEIDSLKKQIKNLTLELNELKNKKNKSNNKNIIKNENNINNSESDDEDENMDDHQIYSMECLTTRLKKEIFQGTERTDIDVVIRNNSKDKYPNDSYLVCDNKNSLLLCEKVKLNELEPFQQQKVSITFKNLKFISKGEYRCIIKLEINKKMFNSYFEIIVNILENGQNQNFGANNFQQNFDYPKGIMPGVNLGNVNMNEGFGAGVNIEMILRFKDQFSLFNNDLITDEKIEQALKRNNFDFNKAFESLYE